MTAPTLRVGNVWTHVDGDPSDVDALLAVLEAPLEGGHGLRGTAGGFFSGLTPLVQDELDLPVVDERVVPCNALPFPAWLDRDYQRQAVHAAVIDQRGIITIPTGGGKTRVAAGIMARLPCRWVFLVHRANLVDDAARTFEKLLGEKVGRLRGGVDDTNHRIVCATYQSMAAHTLAPQGGVIQRADGIIVDEAHRLPGVTAMAMAILAGKAFYRIGLGATPLLREDGRNIHTVALLGPEIFSVKAADLVAAGYLVPPKLTWHQVVQPAPDQEYHDFYTQFIVRSESRNAAIEEATRTTEKPAIVFTKERVHARVLADRFEKLWPGRVEHVNGDMAAPDREAVVARLRSGETQVVVSTSVFYEGVDAPELRSVVVGSAGRSLIEAIQRLGRGTRPSAGKAYFSIHDVDDRGHRWLTSHTEQRLAAYRLAGFTVDGLADAPPVEETVQPTVASVMSTVAQTPRRSSQQPEKIVVDADAWRASGQALNLIILIPGLIFWALVVLGAIIGKR